MSAPFPGDERGAWDHDGAEYEDPTLRYRQRPHLTSIVARDFQVYMSQAAFESNDPTEDTFDIREDGDSVFVGVYDGHGGTKTSAFLKEVRPQLLEAHQAACQRTSLCTNGEIALTAILRDILGRAGGAP